MIIQRSEGIGLTSSVIFGSAPAFNKQLRISILPWSAAICKGVAPPASTLLFAPAYMEEENLSQHTIKDYNMNAIW